MLNPFEAAEQQIVTTMEDLLQGTLIASEPLELISNIPAKAALLTAAMCCI